jgi:hypothetical protein
MTLLSISKFRALLHEMAMLAMVQRLCIDIQKAIPRQSGGISADIEPSKTCSGNAAVFSL